MRIQGRDLTTQNIEYIRGLLSNHPVWTRTKISREICKQWSWCNAKGQLKDIACRSMLKKMAERNLIELPPQKSNHLCSLRHKPPPHVPHSCETIATKLKELRPLNVQPVTNIQDLQLVKCLLHTYHYLSFIQSVGEHLFYLVRDSLQRVVACSLFGAAAWKCAVRDQFIGWTPNQCEIGHEHLANNQRYLILPWVDVPLLASHVLGLIVKRIAGDWMDKYGHKIFFLETFVERGRFKGTCYKAANWIHLGSTQGRSRTGSTKVPIKEVFVYWLDQAKGKEVMRDPSRMYF